MKLSRVVGANLDTQKLVLFIQENEDVKTVEIPQGDPRVALLVSQITGPLADKNIGYADVDLSEQDREHHTSYAEFEQKSSGVVKFFKVAKSFVKNLFAAHDEEDRRSVAELLPPQTMGDTSGVIKKKIDRKAASTPDKIRDATAPVPMSIEDATKQIMANAQPASDPSFTKPGSNSEDTMVAVVQTEKGPVMVPNVEGLDAQIMAAASKLGSPVGVENFLKRMAAVISHRRHSMMELLDFMSRGDLPIAEDGCIIGYKVLRSTPMERYSYSNATNAVHEVPKGFYVDCHSGAVVQRVGSLVIQNNVDLNRRTQCSTGLHIARRRYLSGFSGDIITLVKIAPEDVLAVPEREPDKMRARAYHILFELPKEDHGPLRSNKPIQTIKGKQMLAAAIAGNHIDIMEDVVISGAYGGDLKVTPRDGAKGAAPELAANAPVAEALVMKDENDKIKAPAVDAKAVATQVAEAKTAPVVKAKQEAVPTVSEQRRLFEAKDWAGLLAFKKAKKKGWDKLGFTTMEVADILVGLSATPATVETPAPAVKEKKVKKGTDAKGESPAAKEVAQTHAATKSKTQQVNELLDIINSSKQSKDSQRNAYKELLALKKASKKSWAVLGVHNFEAIQAKFEK